jgi:hypothetical protein
MKRGVEWMLALLVGMVLCWSSPTLWAQDNQPSAQPQGEQQQQEGQTFKGTVIKAGENFLLKEDGNDTSYRLDDPEKVKEYEGKVVTVTGTLEKETNTIHVAKLEPSTD